MTDNRGLTPPVPAAAFNVEMDNRAWMDRRCTPQALATFETQALLTGGGAAIEHRFFILAEGWEPSPFPYCAEQFAGKPGWRVSRLPCGHDVMVDMPLELAASLIDIDVRA